ncbi:MAG: MlaD family protein [Spirochaetota bacterium]|nr:MlaD family protein [Spirochaetota bacterium]
MPVIILLLAILFKLGYSLASTTIDIYLKVDNIRSITKGTNVKIKGYEIGRVVDIKPVYKPALHFLAIMRVKNDIDLYEGCSAIILNQNIIGDTVIELRNPDTKNDLLKDGSIIEGLEYVNLEVIIEDVHTLLSTLTNTIDIFKTISLDSRTNLKTLISNLSESAFSLNQILVNSQEDLIVTLSSFRETAKTMNEISQELKKHPLKFLFKK